MGVKIFKNISQLVTLKSAAKKQARNVDKKDLSIIKNASIVCDAGRIVWVGPQKKLNSRQYRGAKSIDLKGACVLPGFVDCHTHSVFAGDRSEEFELRSTGVSYEQIAEKGGGILSTVKATRKASEAELKNLLLQRVKNFTAQGVTTLEIKSGYGLNLKTELKMLKVIRSLKKPHVVSTFLGAHALPKEYSSSDEYIDDLCEKYLPKVVREKLADRADIFIEKGYFNPEQARRYLSAATELGLQATAHTEQLNNTGGCEIAVQCSATSIDHLVQTSDEQINKISNKEITCVLLPIADFYLKMQYPPASKLISAGARVALSTDFNPGSSPSQDLSLLGVLARMQMGMSLPQVIVALTLGGAYALGMQSEVGSVEVGKYCDLAVLDQGWEELFYQVGHHPVRATYWKGQKIN